MIGYPKHLNTKYDYEYVKENFPKSNWESDFQALLDSQYEWFFVKYLTENEEGISDDTHKVVEEEKTEENSEVKRMQYEYRHNPDCLLCRLGFTEEEVKAALA